MTTPAHEKRWTRRVSVAAAASTALVTLAACGGSTSNSGNGNDGTLAIGMASDTLSLDPTSCAPPTYCFPAYDSLVHQTSAGKYAADLATSWKFLDSGHQTLRLTLRQGAHFTDGTELDAQAVVASMDNFLTTPGPNQSNAVPVDKVTASGKYSVDVHYSTPVTYDFALWQLSGQNGLGTIVGPKGLANPKSLNTTSDGIGPYKLDAAATLKGSVYTYVPNRAYFNQSAIKYSKITLKPMQNARSRLSAVESGQIDWAQAIPATDVDTAKSSGLRISTGKLGAAPDGMPMLVLAQRNTGPLANVKVRQAISYAIPRTQITKAVYGSSATPTSSLVPAGAQGYNEADTNLYPYDKTKAKQLLAEAGYPNGFTLTVFDPTVFDANNTLGQALVSALAAIDIKVNLVSSDASAGTVSQQVGSGKYPAYVWNAGATGTFSLAKVNFSAGAYMNPFKVATDPTLEKLVKQAGLAATQSEQNTLMKAATARLDELEWAVPVASVPTLQATRKDITNVPSSYLTRELDPFSPVTSENWSPANG